MSTKVLAVDDAPDVRRLIQIKIRKAGSDVITAIDGQDGWERPWPKILRSFSWRR